MIAAEDGLVLRRPEHPPEWTFAGVEKAALHLSAAAWADCLRLVDISHPVSVSHDPQWPQPAVTGRP